MIFKPRAIALLVAIIPTLSQLSAQTAPQPMSLAACTQHAIQHSPLVRKSELEIRQGEQYIKEVLSVGYPQININGDFTYNVELPTSLIPGEFFGAPGELIAVQFGTTLNSSAGISLNQLVFDKTFFLGIEATRKLNDLNRLLATKTKEEVAFDVSKMYYQVQLVSKQRQILEANLDQVNRLYDMVSKQQQNGLAKKIDVDQIGVNRINLETQLRNLNLQLEQLLRTLKFYMAMPLDQPITLSDTIDEKGYTLPEASVIKPDFTQQTTLSILDMQRVLNEYNVARYKAGYWPTLSAFGSYNFQGQGNDFGALGSGDNWFRFSMIGLRLNVPVFDGFRKRSLVEQANIELLQIAEDRRRAYDGLQMQYDNAMLQLNTNLNNLKVLAENRRVAEEVYRVSLRRFSEGVAPVTELLTAETSMRQAQTNYLSSLLQVKLAELELLNARGILLPTLSSGK
jgi:outer membrane protein TolC